MILFERIGRSNFMIKLRHWEYWPFGVLQFPVTFYYLWLSIKARSFFFFTASNPSFEMGGMLGESKFGILHKIPEAFKAKTVFISRKTPIQEVLALMQKAHLHFPVIFKPDLGERGYRVKRICNETEASAYLHSFNFDFLIQELIDLPLEFGVFYKRLPSEKNGVVFSIVGKEMLSVVGDGTQTLRDLILKKDRAKLQWEKLKHTHVERLDKVIPNQESVLLNPIGNHCLGTTFLNNNSLISEELSTSFDTISKKIDGFYYGRFDLRCGSLEDLTAGRVKVLELNGCGAEPAHIYQPGYSFWKAVYEMMVHWKSIYRIAAENNHQGVRYLSFKEAKTYYDKFQLAMKS
jgi:hypothetical protein